MQEITPGADGLTDERISRLHLIEQIEGVPYDFLIKTSDIVTEGNNQPVSIKMKTEADNWLIDDIEDIVEDSEVGEFMVEAGVEEMKLSGVQLRENDDRYLIKPPIFLVRSIVAKNEEENTIQMGSLQVPRFLTGCQFPPVGAENAPKFSTFRAEPFYDMPKSFIRALYDADLQALDRIKKRIKNFPGEFAKEKYKPEYLAAFNGEEEELKWLI